MTLTVNNYNLIISNLSQFSVNQQELTEYLNSVNWELFAEQLDENVLFYSSSSSTDFFDLEITLVWDNDFLLVAVPEAKHAYDLI